jgi:bleomycin hydrolase
MKHIITAILLCSVTVLTAQEKTNKKGSEYKFTPVKNLDVTEVQNQNMTGTCWSFSSMSFLESEIIRLGKGKDVNLSEMFIARKAYGWKAEKFIRMHGKTNFGEGGGFPDALAVFKRYGVVPEEIYSGKKEANTPHNHGLLETTLKNILKPTELAETQKINYEFLHNVCESACDEYLGKTPEKFTYKGKEYTPKTYAESTGINPDDYVYITSFTHHPFYSKFTLEVPDNWLWENMYNLPLNEMGEVMSYAITNGYTWAWASDVSEKGFMYGDGLAIVTDVPMNTPEEKLAVATKPVAQTKITQEMRQKAFDNWETQDDHGMHAVGLYKDQNGTPYYLVKNSWGKETNQCDGYLFASESFVLLKTTSIMLHKKGLPPAIAKKLGITQ